MSGGASNTAEPRGRPDTAPDVSVLLVTRDGMATLPATLDAVAAQRTSFPFELVAVDSGSRDGTAELLERRCDRLLRVAPEEFDHGATRNAGIAICRGELVALLVQDALPAGETWLESLTAPLREDPALAGTYARQQPRPGASAVTRFCLSGWAAARAAARLQELTGSEAFAALSPWERHALCTFDNVCSCVRRTVWEQIPFRPTPIAEDVAWAREVLLAGWRLRYTPEAVVAHSHDRSATDELRRTRATHERLAALLGLRTVPTVGRLLRSWAATLRTHWRLTRGLPGERPRALLRALALPLGQYLGGRAGAGAP